MQQIAPRPLLYLPLPTPGRPWRGRGKRVQAPLDVQVFLRGLAAEAGILVWYVDERVIALECHLVRCDLIGGPVIFAVVQGDNAAQLPAIGPEVAHDKGPHIEAQRCGEA